MTDPNSPAAEGQGPWAAFMGFTSPGYSTSGTASATIMNDRVQVGEPLEGCPNDSEPAD